MNVKVPKLEWMNKQLATQNHDFGPVCKRENLFQKPKIVKIPNPPKLALMIAY